MQAKIRAGANSLELAFPGTFEGNRQAQTPEMYGKVQRQALREVAQANDVKFTTHAAYGIMGLSQDPRTGQFQLSYSRNARAEVERAIEFAADVGSGSSVVVHTGEFERPLTHIYPYLDEERGLAGHEVDRNGRELRNYARDKETGRLLFKRDEAEVQQAKFLLLDDRTGQVFETVQNNKAISQPVWRRAKKDYWGYNQKGEKVFIKGQRYDDKGNLIYEGDYIDYEDKKIEDPFGIRHEHWEKLPGGHKVRVHGGRVPEIDPETGRIKIRLMALEDFKKEAEEYNSYYSKIVGKKPDFYDRVTAREMFLKSTLLTQAAQSRAWSLEYGKELPNLIKAKKKLVSLLDHYKKLESQMKAEDLWKIMKQDNSLARFIGDLQTPEMKRPTDVIKERLDDLDKEIQFRSDYTISLEQQAEDTIESMRHLRTPEKFVAKNVTKEYALLGIKAMQETRNKEKPIAVTVENLFPERFGGHPQELKNLIKAARRKMVDLLTKPVIEGGGASGGDWNKKTGAGVWDRQMFKKGKNPYYRPNLTRQEAERLAEQHIKVTFDTGHMNLWRKYWNPAPGKSPEENEKEFRKWYLEQFESLAREGMIGNMHLVDNFGYRDDHLAPGQGNTPVREVMHILKKYGYKGPLTVEPGADASTDIADVYGMLKAWKHLGGQVYGTNGIGVIPSGMPSGSWSNIQYSYFGRNYSPYFVFGGYSPSNDFTFWSNVPLE